MSDVADPPSELRGDQPAACADQVLADRSALALVAVERTRMPMVVADARQREMPIVLANKAFLDLTGYSAEEVIGRNCRFLQGEGTSAAAIASIREALRAEREIDIEILNYRKDDSAFWNKLGLSPVHGEDGKLLYVFGSQIDTTDLRKVQSLEASEHRLLKEVDHRARNVLAIVGGIVRLSRAENAALYATAIQQRVHVLAQAHSLLSERGWKEVSLEQIIRQHISPYREERVTLIGPEVMVSALVVQPLSLVVHELMDNAITHGALSLAGGLLDVRWSAGADYGGFQLRWRETGGPNPATNPKAGFGTTMMTAMIRRQLGGRIEQMWIDGVLTVVIDVPSAF